MSLLHDKLIDRGFERVSFVSFDGEFISMTFKKHKRTVVFYEIDGIVKMVRHKR